MFICCALVKAGYGTLSDIRELDTPDFLDIIEFESISSDVMAWESSKHGNS
jgi:hypothetical protein